MLCLYMMSVTGLNFVVGCFSLFCAAIKNIRGWRLHKEKTFIHDYGGYKAQIAWRWCIVKAPWVNQDTVNQRAPCPCAEGRAHGLGLLYNNPPSHKLTQSCENYINPFWWGTQ